MGNAKESQAFGYYMVIPENILKHDLSRRSATAGHGQRGPATLPPGGDPLHPLRGLPRALAALGQGDPPRPGTGPRREGLM